MSSAPQRQWFGPSGHLLLRVLALVCFILGTLIALGKVGAEWSPALIPGGLSLWVASEL